MSNGAILGGSVAAVVLTDVRMYGTKSIMERWVKVLRRELHKWAVLVSLCKQVGIGIGNRAAACCAASALIGHAVCLKPDVRFIYVHNAGCCRMAAR